MVNPPPPFFIKECEQKTNDIKKYTSDQQYSEDEMHILYIFI